MDERIEQMLNHEVSETRSLIIDNAVKIEFLINGILCRALGLNPMASISFGDTSSALPFISKVHLLMDLKVLSKEDKEKLRGFAEIRNQFAHNFMVMEIHNCSDEILKKLRTWYRPKIKITDIGDFKPLYNSLYLDVKKSIEHLMFVLIEKASTRVDELANFNYNQILYKEVESYCELDTDFKEKFISLVKKASKIYEVNPPSDEFLDSLPLI